MSLILNIDTSTEVASVALCENGKCLRMLKIEDQKGQSTWIHTAIQDLFKDTSRETAQLKAVGLTAGPGSYTGLRVGMATAKGLCYALQIPLIAVNTLQAMAYAARHSKTDLICPMLDAGRMEVYTALYTPQLAEVLPPTARILDQNSFSEILAEKTISFIGNGKNKFQAILFADSASFPHFIFDASQFSGLTYDKYLQSDYASLTYMEPIYLKEYGERIY